MGEEGKEESQRGKEGAGALRTAHSHRLTHSTQVCKAVLSLLRVDQVVSALLGGCSLQHCFKQRVGRRHECSPAGRSAAGLGCLSVAHSLISRNQQPLQVPCPEDKAGGRKDDAWPPWPLSVLRAKGTNGCRRVGAFISAVSKQKAVSARPDLCGRDPPHTWRQRPPWPLVQRG